MNTRLEKNRIRALIRTVKGEGNPPALAWRYRCDYDHVLLEEALQRVYGFARPHDNLLRALSELETSYLLYKSYRSTLWAKLLALQGIDVACDETGEFMEGTPKNRELQIPFLHIGKEGILEVPEQPARVYTVSMSSSSLRPIRGYILGEKRLYQNYRSVMALTRWDRA